MACRRRRLRTPTLREASAGFAAITAVVFGLSYLMDDFDGLNRLSSVMTLGILLLSLVPLTGWAGQINLAPLAFAGFGSFLYLKLPSGDNGNVGWLIVVALLQPLAAVVFVSSLDPASTLALAAVALVLLVRLLIIDYQPITNGFNGLKARVQTTDTDHALDLGSAGAMSLKKLDQLVYMVDNPTHILMSKALRRRLTAAQRATGVSGFITWDKDEFGQKIAYYNDLPILIVDMDDDGARILDFNETGSGGSTATATSLYVVSLGESMLTGLQNGIMEVDDLGEIDAKPVLRTRVEWLVGMAALHGRCAARLRGISNAAVVA